MPERPLAGLRVLELARVLAGPWIGQTLADLGADVIKVESPGGDETRGWGPPFADDGAAAYFHACNRGKRDVVLDFADPRDLARARRWRPAPTWWWRISRSAGWRSSGSTMPASPRANPRVIYASITGFGQDGPLAARAGYDFIVQAMGGIMDLTGEPEGPPQKPGVAYADLFTGLYGTIAVLAALALSERTGRGQWIDLGLFDAQLAVLANQAANHLIGGTTPRRMGNAHPNIAPYQVFEAADGPLVIACGNDGQFARLCAGLGLALHRDPRFATNRDRLAHRAALVGGAGGAARDDAAGGGAGGDGGGRRAGGADQQRRGGLRRAAGAGAGRGAGDRRVARAAEPDAVFRRGAGGGAAAAAARRARAGDPRRADAGAGWPEAG